MLNEIQFYNLLSWFACIFVIFLKIMLCCWSEGHNNSKSSTDEKLLQTKLGSGPIMLSSKTRSKYFNQGIILIQKVALFEYSWKRIT